MKKFRKYFIKSIVVILILLSFAVSIFLIYRHIQRNKNESPITTEKGIDTEEIVEIGGIKQYLSIRGHDANNLILLVLHGGPGSPLSSEQYLYQRGWEKYYTVVNWDQRNAGKTYFLNDPEKTTYTLSISRAMEDTREIVSYLKEKFKKDNVIILGHSWGTILGTTFAQNYPEDVGAYIGVSQAIDVLNTEKNGYEKTLQAVKTAGDEKAFEYLSKYVQIFSENENFNEELQVIDFNAFNTLIDYYREKKEYEKSFQVAKIIEKYFDENLNYLESTLFKERIFSLISKY